MDPLEFLESGEFQIRFAWLSKEYRGAIDVEKGVITINILLALAEIFIHEFIHSQYPFLREEDKGDNELVVQKTERILRRMTKKQIQELGKRLLQLSLIEGGLQMEVVDNSIYKNPDLDKI